jgi:hypothetical protein
MRQKHLCGESTVANLLKTDSSVSDWGISATSQDFELATPQTYQNGTFKFGGVEKLIRTYRHVPHFPFQKN